MADRALASDVGRARRLSALVLALYLAVACLRQAAAGAATADLAALDDEPAHAVTGLLVRDYLAQGLPGNPIKYAKTYYLHYPKVALGHWPPVFYLMQAGWTLAFGASTVSLAALMAALAAAGAWLVFAAARRELGTAAAGTAGLIFLALPLTQKLTGVVMTELALATLSTLAVLCFGRYLESGSARALLGFAGASALAILAKGNALGLALVPPLAIVFARRWERLRDPRLYLAGALVGLLCAPWYAFSFKISRTIWVGGAEPSLNYALEAIPFYLRQLLRMGGVAFAAAALWGFGSRLASRRCAGLWYAAAAWVPALLGMHVFVPTGIDDRHLSVIAPVLVLGAAAGAADVARRWPRGTAGARSLAGVLALAAAFSVERFELVRKDCRGFTRAARELLADVSLSRSALLIASDSKGEGAFVAAVALNERRPGHIVLRASKAVSKSDWMGRGYQCTYPTVEAMAAYLEETPVGVVLVDQATHRRFLHHDLLVAVMEARPELWTPVGQWDLVKEGAFHERALRGWRQRGHEERSPPRLDATSMLSRDLPGD